MEFSSKNMMLKYFSGSAVIDESFHNQFEWAPCTNSIVAERGRAGRDIVGTAYIPNRLQPYSV